jgi:FkbM family methyltransferase
MRVGLAEMLARVAPWGLVAAQSWLLDRLLRRQGRVLPDFDHLRTRLDRVEQTLDRLVAPKRSADPAQRFHARAAGPGPRSPFPPREGRGPVGDPLAGAAAGVRSRSAFVYRTVTLKNGVEYEVALNGRRGDSIEQAVAAGHMWFLDDAYLLLDLVRPGHRVLDLGGHIGTFALAAAALGCRVVCVEAAPQNVALLNASVARNGFDRLHVVWGAVTDHEGTLRFLPHGPWGTIANSTVERAPALIYARELAPVEVPALTVDGILQRLGWNTVDFVKMDIEGSEVVALRRMAGLLSRPKGPVVLFESNGQALQYFGHTPQQLAAVFREFGYQRYLVKSGRLVPTRPDDLQPECVANYLAVKGTPPALLDWRIVAPRSREQTIGAIIAEARAAPVYERAYLARALAEAEASVLSDPRVIATLRSLSEDEDAAVREAAAWFSSSGGHAARGAGA